MEKQARFRHELKYDISYGDYLALRSRLMAVMQPDSHADENGMYQIRSIYFDNYRDKALREKIDGVAKREKFRIRWYNDDFSFITLEKKMKINDLCLKFDAVITEAECRKLLAGEDHWMRDHPEEIVRELYVKRKTQLLRPRVLVSYKREPYVYRPGNVRVTFDSNVRTTLWHPRFMEHTVWDIDAREEPGRRVLEVKYDDYLPEIIAILVQLDARQTAFSKYGACRRFG